MVLWDFELVEGGVTLVSDALTELEVGVRQSLEALEVVRAADEEDELAQLIGSLVGLVIVPQGGIDARVSC